ncbi:hypothetical protein Tco_1224741, partial [Tanacetum coccineum]
KKSSAKAANSFEDHLRNRNNGFRSVLPVAGTSIYLGGRNRKRTKNLIQRQRKKRSRNSVLAQGMPTENPQSINARNEDLVLIAFLLWELRFSGVTASYIDIGDCEWRKGVSGLRGGAIELHQTIIQRSPFYGECDQPRFLQLYVYDTQNEVANRTRHFRRDGFSSLNQEIVRGLILFLDEHNELVKLFQTARDKCNGQEIPEFRIRLYSVVGAQEYDLPTYQTLGTIVFEDGPDTSTDYDVIIESKDWAPQRINKLHPSYMAL